MSETENVRVIRRRKHVKTFMTPHHTASLHKKFYNFILMIINKHVPWESMKRILNEGMKNVETALSDKNNAEQFYQHYHRHIIHFLKDERRGFGKDWPCVKDFILDRLEFAVQKHVDEEDILMVLMVNRFDSSRRKFRSIPKIQKNEILKQVRKEIVWFAIERLSTLFLPRWQYAKHNNEPVGFRHLEDSKPDVEENVQDSTVPFVIDDDETIESLDDEESPLSRSLLAALQRNP